MSFYSFIFILLAAASAILAECPDGCVKKIVYESLGCKPTYEKDTDCCPIKYDCSHIGKTPEDKCMLNGKLYNIGEEIPKELTYPNCKIGCRCIEGYPDKKATINCAILDCPEWLGHRPQPGCRFKYEMDKCCSVGQICPEKDVLEKCQVGEATYLEGDRFDAPGKTCVSCVCQMGFEGIYEEPFCKKATCVEEIRNFHEIKSNYAMVFRKGSCCASEWLSPDEKKKDQIISGKSDKTGLTCKYGSDTIKHGDTFLRSVHMYEYTIKEYKCECKMPPFMTCAKKTIELAPEHIRPHLRNED